MFTEKENENKDLTCLSKLVSYSQARSQTWPQVIRRDLYSQEMVQLLRDHVIGYGSQSLQRDAAHAKSKEGKHYLKKKKNIQLLRQKEANIGVWHALKGHTNVTEGKR